MTGGSGDGDAPADDGEDGGQTDGHREIPGDRRDRGLNELIRAFLHRARRDAARRRMRKPWKGERDKSSNLRCARCAPPGARWAAGLRAAALSAARPAFARDGRLREPPADSHVIAGVRQAPGGGGRVRGHRRRPHARARRARPPSVVLARRLRPAQRAPRAVAGRGRRRAHRAAGVHAARGLIAALCAGAFYFGGASARAPAPGVGARRAWMGETPASQWRARRRRPRSGDGRAGTRREPRACPRASSIVTGRASTTTTTRRGPGRRERASPEVDDDDDDGRRRFGSGSAPPSALGVQEPRSAARGEVRTPREGRRGPARIRSAVEGSIAVGDEGDPASGGEGGARDENHRLAARVDGKEDTAGGDAAGGGSTSSSGRIRATVFQP